MSKENSIKNQERFCFTVLTDMRAKYIKFEMDEKQLGSLSCQYTGYIWASL